MPRILCANCDRKQKTAQERERGSRVRAMQTRQYFLQCGLTKGRWSYKKLEVTRDKHPSAFNSYTVKRKENVDAITVICGRDALISTHSIHFQSSSTASPLGLNGPGEGSICDAFWFSPVKPYTVGAISSITTLVLPVIVH